MGVRHHTNGGPDAVIIGAGPNGLVAANLLADAGWDVLVLEAEVEPGGAVRSAELMEPGFTNDLCSAFYPFSAASSVLKDLDLGRYGLVWRNSPLVLAHPGRDGSCPVLSTDLDETCAVLEAHERGDGEAWRQLHAEWRRVREPLLAAMLGPFPPLRAAARLGTTLRGDLVRFARFSLLPVRRLGEERFTGGAARRLLAGCALHSDLAPEAALSGFLGWLLCMVGQDDGFPVPEGGAGNLTRALVRRLAGRAEVRCGAPVRRVVIRDGRAVGVEVDGGGTIPVRRAVLADVDAPRLFLQLVGAEHLPPRFVDDLSKFHWDHATLKVDWNLDRPIPWTSPPARRAGTVHIAEDVDELTASESELVRGHLPSRPFLLVGQQATTDPSRQPPGRDTVWAYTHLPRDIRADARGEIAVPLGHSGAERFADRVQQRIEALAPGFEASIRGRHVADPAALEAHDGNLVGGAIAGGTNQLHQMLVFRPVPGWGRPETPIRGLFLASASAHPGGAVHGAPGANAARAARRRLPLPRGRRKPVEVRAERDPVASADRAGVGRPGAA
jgi:phytoene dehydrogenase-like protein